MAPFNRIRLTIGGADYIITSDEPESYVRELGEELNKEIAAMTEQDSRISTTMAAVLTALTKADELRKATASADNLRGQIREYLTDNARLRTEAEEYRKEADRLRRELDELTKP